MSSVVSPCPAGAVNAPPPRCCAHMETYRNVWRQRVSAGLLQGVWEQPDSCRARNNVTAGGRRAAQPANTSINNNNSWTFGIDGSSPRVFLCNHISRGWWRFETILCCFSLEGNIGRPSWNLLSTLCLTWVIPFWESLLRFQISDFRFQIFFFDSA